MTFPSYSRHPGRWLLLMALLLTTAVYWPGLSGSWLFDDYPNIVQNPGVQPAHADVASLTRAALSSPSSMFKRPLASLTFAFNYLAAGLNPYSWKWTNLVIHLLNGVLVFVLARMLLMLDWARRCSAFTGADSDENRRLKMWSAGTAGQPLPGPPLGGEGGKCGVVAGLVAAAWLLLPINLTGVLYVVQRMESLANVFVLLGLVGYVAGRRGMLVQPGRTRQLLLCIISLTIPTFAGILAKETAVMLPLYAFLIECLIFRFQTAQASAQPDRAAPRKDWKIISLFVIVLALPLMAGLAWMLPHVLNPEAWATRDFTLRTRLLSEARIVSGYIAWTVLPLPHWLSFYHDNFHISTGWLHPWTTLVGALTLLALAITAFVLRRRSPLTSLGIALFLGCHLLTGTIVNLELIYEHRNYFASFGLMLAIVPLLAVPRTRLFALPRRILLGGLLLTWTVATALTAFAWGGSLRLSRELAARAPDSPRAQYELGRAYIMASDYKPGSPFTPMVYPPLERAAKLPDSSILPQQALIFFNARMHRPIKDAWWDSLIASLKAHKPGVQDESSLAALSQCAREGQCHLSQTRMKQAFKAALSHPHTGSRIEATYSDYAWNVLGNHDLGLHMARRAVASTPDEPAYRITLARMFIANGQPEQAHQQVRALENLNIGGRLEGSIASLRARMAKAQSSSETSPKPISNH